MGLIREVRYPNWISNIVMVRKEERDWRLCIDYSKLNTIRSKNNFSLLEIENLIDKSVKCKLMRFMDAHLGYN